MSSSSSPRKTRILEPPGWPWLLRHELRLGWRGSHGARIWILAAFGALLWAGEHVAAWALLSFAPPERWLAGAAPALIGITVFVLLLMLSLTFALAVRAIYDRGDLDLLGSAPVSPASVYAVRAVGVASGGVALMAFFWTPFPHVAMWMGHPRLLLGLPVLAAMGLACAALAFAGTLVLARVLGVRRARSVAQVLGALIGGLFVIAMQFPNMMPAETQRTIAAWAKSPEGLAWGRTWLGPDSPLAWPARALLGEPIPALALIVLGLAIFVAVIRGTQHAFMESAQRAGEAGGARREGRGLERFRTGLARAVIVKELRLIARDPLLIGKTLLQLLYLVPLVIVIARKSTAQVLAGPALVVMLSTLAGTLAWITVSAEEAHDLLRSAPVARSRVAIYKVAAAVIGPALLAVPLIAWYALRAPLDALVVAIYTALALATSAIIELWTTKPARTRDLATRHRENRSTNLIEALASMGWGAACYFTLKPSFLVVLGLVAAAGMLVLAWVMRAGPE
jgi:ABC-2 type transport system permease protein